MLKNPSEDFSGGFFYGEHSIDIIPKKRGLGQHEPAVLLGLDQVAGSGACP
jgi:hypothetical protein